MIIHVFGKATFFFYSVLGKIPLILGPSLKKRKKKKKGKMKRNSLKAIFVHAL